jgi:hypothetical protein
MHLILASLISHRSSKILRFVKGSLSACLHIGVSPATSLNAYSDTGSSSLETTKCPGLPPLERGGGVSHCRPRHCRVLLATGTPSRASHLNSFGDDCLMWQREPILHGGCRGFNLRQHSPRIWLTNFNQCVVFIANHVCCTEMTSGCLKPSKVFGEAKNGKDEDIWTKSKAEDWRRWTHFAMKRSQRRIERSQHRLRLRSLIRKTHLGEARWTK